MVPSNEALSGTLMDVVVFFDAKPAPAVWVTGSPTRRSAGWNDPLCICLQSWQGILIL